MMNVRKVRVRMNDLCVPMRMRMGFLSVPREIVFVPMMFVVTVPVIVFHRLVRMRMLMALADM